MENRELTSKFSKYLLRFILNSLVLSIAMHAYISLFNSATNICCILSLLHTIWTICTSYHLTTCQWLYSTVIENVWIIHIENASNHPRLIILDLLSKTLNLLVYDWKTFLYWERNWRHINMEVPNCLIWFLLCLFVCFVFTEPHTFGKCPLSLLLSPHLIALLPFDLRTFI